jgi:uncharacterized protein YcbK (DUF882 family)
MLIGVDDNKNNGKVSLSFVKLKNHQLEIFNDLEFKRLEMKYEPYFKGRFIEENDLKKLKELIDKYSIEYNIVYYDLTHQIYLERQHKKNQRKKISNLIDSCMLVKLLLDEHDSSVTSVCNFRDNKTMKGIKLTVRRHFYKNYGSAPNIFVKGVDNLTIEQRKLIKLADFVRKISELGLNVDRIKLTNPEIDEFIAYNL